MTWGVRQTRAFGRTYKKLNNALAAAVDKAVAEVSSDPFAGDKKKGDLAELYVYKFRHRTLIYLLGYTLDAEVRLLYLEAVGPHENFYRDLKRK
jgi:mRNA-degrading endonuclease RelE of RelBE toxin-antitoxin system